MSWSKIDVTFLWLTINYLFVLNISLFRKEDGENQLFYVNWILNYTLSRYIRFKFFTCRAVAYIWSFQSYLLDTYIDSFKLIIFFSIYPWLHTHLNFWRGHRDRDRMVVGLTTTYAISTYHHWCCEFESRSGRCVQQYVIKFVGDMRQVGGFSGSSVFLHN